MTSDPLLICATLLFVGGMIGMVIRRSLLVALFSLSLSTFGAALAFVAFARLRGDSEGITLGALVLVLSAIQGILGATAAVVAYRRRGTLNLDELRELRG